jgi:hypothetical protein
MYILKDEKKRQDDIEVGWSQKGGF